MALRPHHQTHASLHRSHAATGSHTARISSSSRRHKGRKVSYAHTLRGQQAIQPERVTAIQQALIREHYLSSDANGEWDSTTQAAMQKYQADHGWQTKLMPDSRALKSLGLGPDYSDAINANTANFGPPPSITTIPSAQASGFAAAAHVDREDR